MDSEPGALSVKTGGTTYTWRVVEAVSVPDVPVIVTVLFPNPAVLLAVNVHMEYPVVEEGAKDAVTPAGRPLAERLTSPVNPNCGVTWIKLVTVPPWAMVMFDGPERVKAGGWI